MFPYLKALDTSGNFFQGQIPSSISQMTKLDRLYMSDNKFFGKLPSQFLSNCSSLTYLDLSDNNLQGDILPDQMNLPSLPWLKLSNNSFSGIIKDALIKSSTTLNYFDISNNKLTGSLPNWIGNFSNLDVLVISKNFLHGHIPPEICKLQLVYLDFSENNLNRGTTILHQLFNTTVHESTQAQSQGAISKCIVKLLKTSDT